MTAGVTGGAYGRRSLRARLRRPGIATRVTIVALAVLLAVQAILLAGYQQDLEERRAAELENAVTIGQTVAAVVDSFARDLERSTFATAFALARQDGPLDQGTAGPALAAQIGQYNRLRAIFLTDGAGRVVASDSGAGVGTDLSTRPYLPPLRAGAERVWSGSLAGLESGEVTIAFGLPVRVPGAPPRGYLIAAFQPGRLADGLPLNPPPDSEIVFIDERGQLLHSTLRPDIPVAQRALSSAPGVAAALRGHVSPVLAAHTPLQHDERYGVFVPAPRMGWVVGFTRPQAAMEARLRQRLIEDASAVALVVLLGGVFLTLVARRISAPLRRLAAAAQQIAAGKRPLLPSRPATVAAQDDDEVGRLAAAMDAMAAAVAEREERLRAAAEENARLYEEAQAAVRLREEFLSIAAHELKTPLTSVRGAAQLTLRRLDREGSADPERWRTSLELIDSQSAKLATLVERLLDVSRLRAGKLALEHFPTDLAQLLREVAERAQGTTRLHVVVVHAPEALRVDVDPLRIEQVITNLLDNAIKYSPEGGAIEVTLAALPQSGIAGRVRLTVRDHGTGIPAEHAERVFDRFFQAHTGRHLSGMGLGLYISREIVELHGGTIAVHAPPGGGTEIEIILPRAIPATMPAASPAVSV
ncbi:MAG TPA: sensor histidine kinase [Chloroflexota bacterium]|nr:sensor histidine kinase [Chloroflexota bacterium]